MPYQPVCAEAEIPVCVHPAYQRMLPEVTTLINDTAQPLVGLPGVPVRAEQRRERGINGGPSTYGPPSNGTIFFDLHDVSNDYNGLPQSVAVALVEEVPYSGFKAMTELGGENPDPCQDPEKSPTAAQAVVEDWLRWQTGRYPSLKSEAFRQSSMSFCPGSEAALERFVALDPKTRDSWLRENYAALRAGKITLGDLP